MLPEMPMKPRLLGASRLFGHLGSMWYSARASKSGTASRRRDLEQGERISGNGMEFEASIEERSETYSVVAVRGEVDLHTAPKLEYAMQRGAEGVEAVVVDLSRVAFMDSTALSTLMRARDHAEETGVSLRLAAPSKAVERIFAVTGFGDYFEIFPTREAALPQDQ